MGFKQNQAECRRNLQSDVLLWRISSHGDVWHLFGSLRLGKCTEGIRANGHLEKEICVSNSGGI